MDFWKDNYTLDQLKTIKRSNEFKSLAGTIEAMHKDQYKTAIPTDKRLYIVGSRVNYSVIRLWAEKTNSDLKRFKVPENKIESINRIGWLVMQKNYRRYVDSVIKEYSEK